MHRMLGRTIVIILGIFYSGFDETYHAAATARRIMSNRLTYFASVALATAALIVTGCTGVLNRAAEPDTSPPPTAKAAPLSIKPASYLGVYEPGAPRSYQGITTFGRDVGRIPNLALYYSGWGHHSEHNLLPRPRLTARALSCKSIPPVFSLQVAQGDDDAYLREYADAVRDLNCRSL